MQRRATIFTVLVFAVLLGGLLTRDGEPRPADRPAYLPSTPRNLPPLVDPLGIDRDPSAARDDRLEVRVIDEGGAPVRGAALIVRAGVGTLWALTGEDGRGTLTGLSAGKSRLAVLAFPHRGLETDVEPSAATLEITLPPVPPPPARIPEIVRSRFAGRLDWSGSESPADFEVVLIPEASPAELSGALPRSANCDADGRFVFEDLAHGLYSLAVLPPWAGGGSWPDLVAPSDRRLDFQAEVLERAVTLARGSIEGEVLDDQGRPLLGALVIAVDVLHESRVWPACSTDPEGRFRVRDVPPGTYRVTCRAGEGGSSLEALVVAPGETAFAALPPFAPRKRP